MEARGFPPGAKRQKNNVYLGLTGKHKRDEGGEISSPLFVERGNYHIVRWEKQGKQG